MVNDKRESLQTQQMARSQNIILIFETEDYIDKTLDVRYNAFMNV